MRMGNLAVIRGSSKKLYPVEGLSWVEWSCSKLVTKVRSGSTPEVAWLSLKVGFPVSVLQAKEQIGVELHPNLPQYLH